MGKQRNKTILYFTFAAVTVLYTIVTNYSEALGIAHWRSTLVMIQFVATVLILWVVASEMHGIMDMQKYIPADDIEKRKDDHYVLKETCSSCGNPLIALREKENVFKRCESGCMYNVALAKIK